MHIDRNTIVIIYVYNVCSFYDFHTVLNKHVLFIFRSSSETIILQGFCNSQNIINACEIRMYTYVIYGNVCLFT